MNDGLNKLVNSRPALSRKSIVYSRPSIYQLKPIAYPLTLFHKTFHWPFPKSPFMCHRFLGFTSPIKYCVAHLLHSLLIPRLQVFFFLILFINPLSKLYIKPLFGHFKNYPSSVFRLLRNHSLICHSSDSTRRIKHKSTHTSRVGFGVIYYFLIILLYV